MTFLFTNGHLFWDTLRCCNTQEFFRWRNNFVCLNHLPVCVGQESLEHWLHHIKDMIRSDSYQVYIYREVCQQGVVEPLPIGSY